MNAQDYISKNVLQAPGFEEHWPQVLHNRLNALFFGGQLEPVPVYIVEEGANILEIAKGTPENHVMESDWGTMYVPPRPEKFIVISHELAALPWPQNLLAVNRALLHQMVHQKTTEDYAVTPAFGHGVLFLEEARRVDKLMGWPETKEEDAARWPHFPVLVTGEVSRS